jgi:CubicO group peptidase (beta-lactamase class C family)
MKLILSKPLLSRPGEKYRYSNPGFSLLAAIVEKVSGQPYERFLNGQLFQPAGMTKTGYRLPKWDPKEISHNYSDGKDNGPPLDRVWASDGPYWHLFGNGGILSTTGDMYRWQLALDGETVLSAAEKAKLFKPYMPTDNPSTFYAYGWTVGKTRAGAPVIGHTGGSEFGVWAAHFRFPDDRTVVIVQCNQIPVPGNEDHKLPERLDDIASGRSSGSS